jgi:pyruvate kinase
MGSLVEYALETVPCEILFVPTRGGTTARIISRCKPSVWIIAPSRDAAVCQRLTFSYGVHPVNHSDETDDWREFASRWLRDNEIVADRVMLVAGPSPRNPNASHRIELMRLGGPQSSSSA